MATGRKIIIPVLLGLYAGAFGFAQQPARYSDVDLPLRSVSLFSSGVAFFEHRGTVAGNAEIELFFSESEMDDVLKSLTVIDAGSVKPSVAYESGDTARRTLESLRIDLSDSPDFPEILNRLKGEEIEVQTSVAAKGMLVGVDRVFNGEDPEGRVLYPKETEIWITVSASGVLQRFSLSEIKGIVFTDPVVNADLATALGIIKNGYSQDRKSVRILLPGTTSRTVSVSYVVASPVWKTSWRLSLAKDSGFLQGWALADNTSAQDWTSVSLSFLNGRPASFIQPLYTPVYVERPVVPLSNAGTARPESHSSGFSPLYAELSAPSPVDEQRLYKSAKAAELEADEYAYGYPEAAPSVENTSYDAVTGDRPGTLFRFTTDGEITVPRHRSIMVPLVQGAIEVEQFSLFSGAEASARGLVHPRFGARLRNNAGMSLPAGPVVVLEDGLYAGDALLDFVPEKGEGVISWGDDLSVTGAVFKSETRTTRAARISGGVLTLLKTTEYRTEYALKNTDSRDRTVLLEHPVRAGAELAEPKMSDSRTDDEYRFKFQLPAGAEQSFVVVEQRPAEERIAIIRLTTDSLLSYAASGEFSAELRSALERAAALKRDYESAQNEVHTLETSRDRLFATQERIRQNLSATGADTAQGKDYLMRLAASEKDIDEAEAGIESAMKIAEAKKAKFENYLAALVLK